MNIKDKLQIYLITYNRKEKLKFTLNSILDESSPIRDFDIMILDNASTDGSSELIEDYCKNYPNIKHIRHPHNIGGNANIVRAFEMGANCGKEYVWVLCDDDKYDFSNWQELEEAINKKYDIIGVADYLFPNPKDKTNPAYQIPQLTFVPAGIYRTELITSDVLINMYDCILTMFQQTCLSIDVINKKGSIYFLSKPLVFNGLHFDDGKTTNVSYTRGMKSKTVLEQRKNTSWVLGFVKVLTLLNNKKLRNEALSAGIKFKDICGSWNGFYKVLNNSYLKPSKLHYFLEIYGVFNIKQKFEFLIMLFPIFIKNFIRFIFSIYNEDNKTKVYCFMGIKVRKDRKRKISETNVN